MLGGSESDLKRGGSVLSKMPGVYFKHQGILLVARLVVQLLRLEHSGYSRKQRCAVRRTEALFQPTFPRSYGGKVPRYCGSLCI
jgi:hypothetical protein